MHIRIVRKWTKTASGDRSLVDYDYRPFTVKFSVYLTYPGVASDR